MRDDYTPECETAAGCPIGDLAADPALTSACERFLMYKALWNLTEDPAHQQALAREFGLYDDPQLHLAIEEIYTKWQRQIQDQHRSK